MAEDRKTVKTPAVIFIYPKISKPDTFGKKADGKYKTQFQFKTEEETKKFQTWCRKVAAEQMPDTKKAKMPWTVQDETNEVWWRAGSKYKPLVADSKNNKIPASVLIGGGTEGRLELGVNCFDGRLSFYLNAVQITKLVEYKPKNREDMDSPFEEIDDGFVFEGNADEGDEIDAEGENKGGFGSSSADADDDIPF